MTKKKQQHIKATRVPAGYYYTVAEAAERLGYTPVHLYRLMYSGDIDYERIGTHSTIVHASSVEEYAKRAARP